MRGKPGNNRSLKGGRRITPAGAGKTPPAYFLYRHGRDHPRRCGENISGKIDKILYIGSPPQVRGKHTANKAKLLHCGITPAGAGKTSRKTKEKNKNKDHPRRCGENSATCSGANSDRGSPPQVRGKRTVKRSAAFYPRITPAGADTDRYAWRGFSPHLRG